MTEWVVLALLIPVIRTRWFKTPAPGVRHWRKRLRSCGVERADFAGEIVCLAC
jgi:hypothetical protein